MDLSFVLRARRAQGEAIAKEELLAALGLVERVAGLSVVRDLASLRLEFAQDAVSAASFLDEHPADQFAQLRAAGIQLDVEVIADASEERVAVALPVDLLVSCALRDLPVTVLLA